MENTAEVAELVDAHDSNSCVFGRVGSIPTFGTTNPCKPLFIGVLIFLTRCFETH